ncbi:MAG: PAS domain-containing protein [Alphaproteobacteria bacterium]|nr:PAS domain-containing protein [Alphaproteobacteria bacterium]
MLMSLNQDLRNQAAAVLEPTIFLPVWQYWQRCLPGDGTLPGRHNLDPLDMPRLSLPYTLLVDVLNRGERLRFRLIGTELVKMSGRNLTGKFYDECYASSHLLSYIHDLYAALLETRRPLYTENIGTPGWAHGPRMVRRLMLPLAGNGQDIDMVYGVQDFTPVSEDLDAREYFGPNADVAEVRRVFL